MQRKNEIKNLSSTRMGFEPTRAEHIGLAVQRLNHSATSSTDIPLPRNTYKLLINITAYKVSAASRKPSNLTGVLLKFSETRDNFFLS